MKKIISLLFTISLFVIGCNSEQEKTREPKLYVENSVVNFGSVFNTDTVYLQVKISNTGDDTLQLYKAGASCGCTTPKLHSKTLAPNESTLMDIRYRPNEDVDSVTKTIMIDNNSKEPLKVIKIKGFIKRAE